MNKLRKLFAISLILSILCTLPVFLSACDEEKGSAAPTDEPTLDLATTPTEEAGTSVPTEASTEAPTVAPTEAPTKEPTKAPTEAKTEAPTQKPTSAPTEAKTEAPTQKPTSAPTEAKTEAKTEENADRPDEQATSGASYENEVFENTVNDTWREGELTDGSLYDALSGAFTPEKLISLYDLCPVVDGVRVYALIDDKASLSHDAASALAMLAESAYRATSMRVHIRTVDHMEAGAVGYADYASRYSVKLGYYEDSYYSFDAEKTRPLADYIRKNAYRYGFIWLGNEEDVGHFRYVGVPHAVVMKDYELKTLAEYHVFLAGQKGALRVSFEDVVYYVQSFSVKESAVTVSVPEKHRNQYTLALTGNGSAVMTVTSYASGLGNRLPYVADVNANRGNTVICLDAGHGAHDPGAVWPQKGTATYLEKNYNLAVALQAKAYLEAMGYRVIMTRADDTFVALSNRVSYAKQYGADLFISLHCNSTANPESSTAVGPQVYFNASDKTQFLNWTIARTFANAMNEGTASFIAAGDAHPVEESDIRNGNYAVLSDLVLPSVLLEMGFITNEGDRALFENARWQETMGYSVALAVETLFANDQLK